MQLYFSPFACSLATHIAAREAGLDLALTAVTLLTKRTAAGDDYLAVAPKGQVPVLRLDDGSLMSEGPAILQYVADTTPSARLLPPVGTRERYEALEWLNYVGTEIHKQCFYPMFSPEAPPEAKAWARSSLEKKLAHLESRLAGRSFVAGDHFTIADAYLTWALTLCTKIGVDLASYRALAGYLARMQARPAVQAAIAAESAVAAQAAKSAPPATSTIRS